MTLLSFDEKAFKAHPKVKQFYCLLDGKTSVLLPTNSLNLNTTNVQRSTFSNIPYCYGNTHQLGKRSYTSLTPPQHSITLEQKMRMEENRQKALSRQTKESAAVVLFHSSVTNGIEKNNWGKSGQLSSQNQLTSEQKMRIEENRKRALATRAKKAQQQQRSSQVSKVFDLA
mmetsp:Transcript_17812/g.40460  ORF Transcript_17812/g.40460 Transcript_17812/m.40460 type:complete len:171 (-) Transcript_17812:89-601(-)